MPELFAYQNPRPAVDVDPALESIDSLVHCLQTFQDLFSRNDPHPGDNLSSSTKDEEAQAVDATHRFVGDCRGDDSRINKDSITASSARRPHGEKLKVYNEAEKLLRNLEDIQVYLFKLKNVGSYLEHLKDQAEKLYLFLYKGGPGRTANLSTRGLHVELQLLGDKVMDIRNQLLGHYGAAAYARLPLGALELGFNLQYLPEADPVSDMKERVLGTSCFADFLEDFSTGAFASLDLQSKLCLCCFSIFPEDCVLPKKLLEYWWIGEGLVDPELLGNKTTNEVLMELCSKGLVEPVLKKWKLFGFRIDPMIRFVVIAVADRLGFFSFDSMAIPTADFFYSHRACLVKNQDRYSLSRYATHEKDPESSNAFKDRLQTLFNLDEDHLDFEWDMFLKFNMLNVLCLGGWQGSMGNHIVAESTEFLRQFQNMKHLKFLSLQGISKIDRLPDSLCALTSLKILDLNSCHHLESLPKKLKQLKNLTHLDISECLLLVHLPKGLSQLKKLQVLKGFVVVGGDKDSCTLDDLKGLKNLRKLSITSSRDDFPSNDEVAILQGFEYLKKLKIAWRGKSSAKAEPRIHARQKKGDKGERAGQLRPAKSPQTMQSQQSSQTASSAKSHWGRSSNKLFGVYQQPVGPRLDKLELQCYPLSETPIWMVEGKLNPSNKLYIRGGNLRTLKDGQGSRMWDVKILCLKYLANLEMDWRELSELFPDLVYLEKCCCPKLTMFPCNLSGVWINKTSDLLEEAKKDFSWSFLT